MGSASGVTTPSGEELVSLVTPAWDSHRQKRGSDDDAEMESSAVMGRTVDVWEEARRNNQQSRVCGAGAGKVLRQLGERRMEEGVCSRRDREGAW